MAEAAQIGVTGLAVMGRNLARNFARHGYRVASTTARYARPALAGRPTTATRARSSRPSRWPDFVASLDRPRRVIIMVKAGGPTDAVIEELVPLLDEGDIIIDAGNAHFPDTIRREHAAGRAGSALRRHRGVRRRGGRAARPVDHAGRIAGVLRVARSDAGEDRREGRRHARAAPTSAPTAPATS